LLSISFDLVLTNLVISGIRERDRGTKCSETVHWTGLHILFDDLIMR